MALMASNLRDRIRAARIAFDRSEYPAAEKDLRGIISDFGMESDAMAMLGIICHRTNRPGESGTWLTGVLKQDPFHYEALIWLGQVRKARGSETEAIALFRRALEQRPDDPAVLTYLGQCYLALGEIDEAETIFRQVVALRPKSSKGLHNLGLALKSDDRSYEALELFKRAIELDPRFLGNYVQISRLMGFLHNWQEAIPLVEDGLRRHPTSIALTTALAHAYSHVGKGVAADDLFKSACKVDPSAASSYARWLNEVERCSDSLRALEDSISRQPIQGQAYYMLAAAKNFKVKGKALDEVVLGVLGDQGLRDEARMFLHYALAMTYEDRTQYEKAKTHYDVANDLAYRTHNVRESFNSGSADKILATKRKIYSQESILKSSEKGSLSPAPIFIVGMVRSGLSLLEEILSCHPSVVSVGEHPFWHLRARTLDDQWSQSGINASQIPIVAKEYLDILQARAGGSQRIVNRFSLDYMHLGLIHVAFPKARIIHLKRNPLDTCLSIYSTYLGDRFRFTYSQDHIIGAYRQYMDLMGHWRTALPSGTLHEINYEDLVVNPDAVCRELLAFCSLDWHEACASQNSINASRSSLAQESVSRPIYRSSVGRWHHFETWLESFGKLKELSHPSDMNR